MAVSRYAIFAKTAELGGLTKAAQALGLTQSAVSHAIASLEESLSLRLLTRDRGGARLTEEGRCILESVRGVLAAEDALLRTAAGLRGEISGMVRIGAFTSVAVHWLPGMIKAFEQTYPNVELGLLNGDYHDIGEWLRAGSIDVGFVTLPFDLPGCACSPLMEDRLLAVLPNSHPLADLARFPIAQFEKEPFISLLESSNHDARRTLELAGVHANVKFSTKDDYAIIAMIEQGLGISIMPELLLTGQTANVRVIPLDIGARRTIGIAIPEASAANPCVQRFVESMRLWLARRYPCGTEATV